MRSSVWPWEPNEKYIDHVKNKFLALTFSENREGKALLNLDHVFLRISQGDISGIILGSSSSVNGVYARLYPFIKMIKETGIICEDLEWLALV